MIVGEEIKDYIIEKSSLFLLSSGEIYSLHVSGFGDNFRVQLQIDKIGQGSDSFSLDELGEMSQNLSVLLEKKDYSEFVSLEVSTPGAERELRIFSDYERFQGNLVNLSYEKKGKIFTAVFLLKNVFDGILELEEFQVQKNKSEGKKKKIEIAFSDVKKANLYIDI